MATFSREFLSNLGQPAMTQSLFNLGTALGSVPGAMKAKRKRKAQEQLFSELSPGSLEYTNALIAQAVEEEDWETVDRLSNQSKAQQAEKARAKLLVEDLQTILIKLRGKTDSKSVAQRETAQNLLSRVKEVGSVGSDFFHNSVKELQKEVGGEQISSVQAAELSENFTSESVAAFTVSGDVSTLVLRDTNTKDNSSTPSYHTLVNSKGKNVVYAVWRDSNGNVKKVPVGEAEADDETKDSKLNTSWGSKLLTNERDIRDEAAATEVELEPLIHQVTNRKWYDRGLFGSIIQAAEEKTGMGSTRVVLRKTLTKFQVTGAINLLPKGPASDKDIALVMRASIDVNELDNEEAESFLRGLQKIARLQKEYSAAKVDFITNTGDPNALGFEAWVRKTRAEKEIQGYKDNIPDSLEKVRELIEKLPKDPVQRKIDLEAIKETSLEPIVLSLENLTNSNKEWEELTTKYESLQGL